MNEDDLYSKPENGFWRIEPNDCRSDIIKTISDSVTWYLWTDVSRSLHKPIGSFINDSIYFLIFDKLDSYNLCINKN